MGAVTVSPKYQVVIPLVVRERAHIRAGERQRSPAAACPRTRIFHQAAAGASLGSRGSSLFLNAAPRTNRLPGHIDQEQQHLLLSSKSLSKSGPGSTEKAHAIGLGLEPTAFQSRGQNLFDPDPDFDFDVSPLLSGPAALIPVVFRSVSLREPQIDEVRIMKE